MPRSRGARRPWNRAPARSQADRVHCGSKICPAAYWANAALYVQGSIRQGSGRHLRVPAIGEATAGSETDPSAKQLTTLGTHLRPARPALQSEAFLGMKFDIEADWTL